MDGHSSPDVLQLGPQIQGVVKWHWPCYVSGQRDKPKQNMKLKQRTEILKALTECQAQLNLEAERNANDAALHGPDAIMSPQAACDKNKQFYHLLVSHIHLQQARELISLVVCEKETA